MKPFDDNIILIGMPACGKSTVGVLLAKTLGMDFLDTDLLIQTRTGKRLSTLIEERGMEGFVQLESDLVSTLRPRRTVLATGGSVVLGAAGMAHLKTLGRVVYLRVPPDTVEQRIGDITARGVVIAPGKTIFDVYRARTPLYEAAADLTVDSDGTAEQTVTTLAAILESGADS